MPVKITSLAAHNCLNEQTFRKQYKEKSVYRTYTQFEHTGNNILYSDNIVNNISLDETCLSIGDVYIILTDKAAHDGKGALDTMVRGEASNTVVAVLKKILSELLGRSAPWRGSYAKSTVSAPRATTSSSAD